MKRIIALMAAAPLMVFAALPATASLTREQLTEQCRPQLQTMVQEVLNEPVTEETAIEDDPDPQYAAEQAASRAQNARDMASLRANGLNDPFVHMIVDEMRKAGASQGKLELRKGLKEMKQQMQGITDASGLGPDTGVGAAAVCLVEAILADIDGKSTPTSQSASAATVAARNKAAAEAAAVPPLRPTAALEAHNPANEASQCLEPIARGDFDGRGVSSTAGAVFRNSCAYPVETQWCVGDGECSRGFGNLATMPANGDRGFSFDHTADTITKVSWAGCRLGFGYRPDFAGTRNYVCK